MVFTEFYCAVSNKNTVNYIQSNLNYKILLIPLKERDKVVSVSLPWWAGLSWLKANKLSLNVAKTEFRVIRSRQKLQSLTGYTMNIHIDAYLPTLPVFLGVCKLFIKSPGLPIRAPDLPGNTYRAFFQFFFINFVIFEMSERKIKKEVKLVLLFELFSIGKRKNRAIKLIYI